MENQHRKIKGYRELSQEEIDLMNRIKEQGEVFGDLLRELAALRKLQNEKAHEAVNSGQEPELTFDQLGESATAHGLAEDHLKNRRNVAGSCGRFTIFFLSKRSNTNAIR